MKLAILYWDTTSCVQIKTMTQVEMTHIFVDCATGTVFFGFVSFCFFVILVLEKLTDSFVAIQLIRCATKHQRDGQNQCSKCPPASENRGFLSLGAVLVIFAVGILVYLQIKNNGQGELSDGELNCVVDLQESDPYFLVFVVTVDCNKTTT